MKFRYIVAASLMLFTVCASSGAAAGEFPPLRDAGDPRLQRLLERSLDRIGLSEAARADHLAVALVDISDIHQPRLAAVNGDTMMYAASLPKIGILLAALHEVERGRMTLTSGLRRSLHEMIRVSSNVEATRVMNLVGKQRVNQILASKRYRLYDRLRNGGLWVGKEYGPRPAFERDPLHNLSHGATVLQVARFYYLLAAGELLRPDLNAELKRALGEPGIFHKFVKGLHGRNVEIYRKSGSWRHWHADSALVETPRGSYILVGLVADSRGGEWLPKIARTLHDAMYPAQFARK
ncbi:MAG: serine hydrolase [Gammaproteobacteria bacterium]